MLWIEKYNPASLIEIKYRDDIVNILKKFRLDSIPHLLFYGKSGHGKKTTIKHFLDFLHNKKIETRSKTAKVQSGSKEIEVNYLFSDEYVEISPSDYEYQDKNVIQGIIKSLAQTKSINHLFSVQKTQALRFIIINQADELTKDAQAALRRTLERYSCNFRLILVCEEINTIIEPLRSRCLPIRFPKFSNQEIEATLLDILSKEKAFIDKSILQNIVCASNGSMRKALCLTENYAIFEQVDDDRKSKKIKNKENPHAFLEYEKRISKIVDDILKFQNSNMILNIRQSFYTLLNSCIPSKIILQLLVRYLILAEKKFNLQKKIAEFGSLYDERLKNCSKEIIHLEAFVVSVMSLYC